MPDDIARRQPAAAAVVEWLISGVSEAEVVESLRAKYPDVDAGATLAAVRDHLAREGTPDADALRGWVLLAYRELYRRLLDNDDLEGARKVVKNIAEAAGL
jgi:hypothetical protein